MKYPASHRHAVDELENGAEVDTAGQLMGTMVLAGQYELAGQGCEAPYWQKYPGRQLLHCHPLSATLLLATRYVPLLQVQFEAGSQVDIGGHMHCVGRLAPGSENVPKHAMDAPPWQ